LSVHSGDTVLVTGASGFVGRAVCGRLIEAGCAVRALHGRRPAPAGTQAVHADLAAAPDWPRLLDGARAVVHLAGMAHAPVDRVARDALRRVNVRATAELARAAAAAGVRLVFVSSAKVLGATGHFNDAAPPAPPDLYAESKWAAEQELAAIPGLDYAILRPPLVYGPGVGANFLKLLKLMDSGLPLPFGAVTARRSLIGVANLADAIRICLAADVPDRRAYLVADGPAPTLAELLGAIAAGLGRPARLFPFPVSALAALSRLAGRGEVVERLFADLVVDDRDFLIVHGWQPPVPFAQGLAETCAWYRGRQAGSAA
jgi:nucleoside-diphosphate-sugar epimerase